jgi:dsRNA-specific ribonuclease
MASWSQHLPPKFSVRPGGTSSQSLSKGRFPVPELSGDLSLEVFTHGSLALASPDTKAAWGDKTHLAVLGEQVMRLIVTWSLFFKRPMPDAKEITQAREEYLSDANVHSWTDTSGLRIKYRVSQGMGSSFEAREVRGDTA